MNAPQIIFLSLLAIELLSVAHLHDKPKTGEYNFFVTLMNVAATIGLLLWGGFFK